MARFGFWRVHSSVRGQLARLACVGLVLAVSGCAADATPSHAPQGSGAAAGASAATSAPSATTSVDTSQLVVDVSTVGSNIWSVAKSGDVMEQVGIGLYDPLIVVDPKTRQYVGQLAASWSLSPDGTTWDFKLRPNVQFHDGWGTVTSADVKYTWEQWIGPDSDHSPLLMLSQAVDGKINNFEIVNDLEFKLHTTHPVVLLENVLGISGLQVTSKKYHDQMGAAADLHPIGTGPWKYVSSTPGVNIVFDRNDSYWGTVPAFKRLILQEVADASARLVQVQSGAADIAELDVALMGEASSAGLKLVPQNDCCNAFVVVGGMYPGDPAYDRNAPWIQADHPEKGLAIRQAMSLAIDRPLILSKVINGQGKLSYGVINESANDPNTNDPSWTLPSFDLVLAKQKLAEGGYPNGFPVTMPLMNLDTNTADIGEAIAGMWEDLGLKVTRVQMEEAVLRQKQTAKTTAGMAWVMEHGLDQTGATGFLRYLSTAANSKFFDPAIDAAYAQMVTEPDPAVRWAIYRAAETKLLNNVSAIPLMTVNKLYVAGPKVGSWDIVPQLNIISGLETVKP